MRLALSIAWHMFYLYFAGFLVYLAAHGTWWVPTAILAIWCGILLSTSKTWCSLQTTFPGDVQTSGRRFWMIAVDLDGYRYSVNLKVGLSGIRMTAIPIFRLFHPPIFVAWSDFTLSHPDQHSTLLEFKNREIPPLHICHFISRDDGGDATDVATTAQNGAGQMRLKR